jgi:hypothetical protein
VDFASVLGFDPGVHPNLARSTVEPAHPRVQFRAKSKKSGNPVGEPWGFEVIAYLIDIFHRFGKP